MIDVEAIDTVDPGGRSTIDIEVINAEAINTVDLGVDDHHRGSTVNFHVENSKDFKLIFPACWY